jgi:Raf kinase inhibitor-like YbhB/YbcL family protein
MMELTSSVFNHEGKIPSKYTCDGENCSPRLMISNVPAEAKSLVLIMDDPDVPRNLRKDGLWVHWVVFNIPPSITEIPEGREPEGIHGEGTAGNTGYYGPCPPDREHRYYFKLYALDRMLDLPEKTDKFTLEKEMAEKILEQAVLMGKYERT